MLCGVMNASMPPSAATMRASTVPSGPFKLTVWVLMPAMRAGLENRMEIRASVGTSVAPSCGEEALTSAAPPMFCSRTCGSRAGKMLCEAGSKSCAVATGFPCSSFPLCRSTLPLASNVAEWLRLACCHGITCVDLLWRKSQSSTDCKSRPSCDTPPAISSLPSVSKVAL